MNRWVQRISLAVLLLLALLAATADLVAYWTGFSFDEIHLENRQGESGSWSLPQSSPTRQQIPGGFQFLDQDGDGRLQCLVMNGHCSDLLHHEILRLTLLTQWHERENPESPMLASSWDRAIDIECMLSDCDPVKSAQMDGNQDGVVDPEERLQALRLLDHRANTLLAMDRNGNLDIEADEFTGFVTPSRNWLGTDMLGRDRLVRWLYGLRISLLVALAAALVSTLLGTFLGLASGIRGGWPDRGFLRFLEVFQAIPFIVVLILLSLLARELTLATSGRSHIGVVWHMVVLFSALGAVQWFSLARYARGIGSNLRESNYVLVLRRMGYPMRSILWRHILPNAWFPILGFASILVPTVILEEAFLSFLGFGVQPPFPSLGVLLGDGIYMMHDHPLAFWLPAGTLILLSWSLFVLAEGWRLKGAGRIGGRP